MLAIKRGVKANTSDKPVPREITVLLSGERVTANLFHQADLLKIRNENRDPAEGVTAR
jgi:hypothetical protein